MAGDACRSRRAQPDDARGVSLAGGHRLSPHRPYRLGEAFARGSRPALFDAVATGRRRPQAQLGRRQGRAAANRAHGAAHPSRPAHRVRAGAEMEIDDENPARDASAPSPQKARVKNFDAEQVEKLLAAARRDAETYAITALFLACGLRRSELLGLAFDCVDLTTRCQRSAHGGRGRSCAGAARAGQDGRF